VARRQVSLVHVMAKRKRPAARKLTAKMLRFVDEYLIDLDGTAAYKRAGYRVGGTSGKSAGVCAAKLLKRADVAAAIAAGQSARAERTAVTQDRVLAELARIAFGDLANLLDENGALKSIEKLPRDVSAAIASVKVTKEKTTVRGGSVVQERVTEVRAWDKNRALELIAQHLGMLKSKHEVEHKGGIGIAALTPEQLRAMSDEQIQAFKAGVRSLLALVPGALEAGS
jgi:phage terminase small subunit